VSEEKSESEVQEENRNRVILRLIESYYLIIISVIVLSDIIYIGLRLGIESHFYAVLLTAVFISIIQGFVTLRQDITPFARYIQFAFLGIGFVAIGVSTTTIIYSSLNKNNPETWVALDAPERISDRDVYIIKAYIKKSITEKEITEFVIKQRQDSKILDERDGPLIKNAQLEPVMYASLTALGFKISPEKQEPRNIRKPKGELQWTWALSFDKEFGLPIEGNSYPLTLTIEGSEKDGDPRSRIATITKNIFVKPSRDTIWEKVLSLAKELKEFGDIMFFFYNALGIVLLSAPVFYLSRRSKSKNRRIQHDPMHDDNS
jgi:hypothetical protein